MAVDLLTGGPDFRSAADARASIDDFVARERADAERFDAERRVVFLY